MIVFLVQIQGSCDWLHFKVSALRPRGYVVGIKGVRLSESSWYDVKSSSKSAPFQTPLEPARLKTRSGFQSNPAWRQKASCSYGQTPLSLVQNPITIRIRAQGMKVIRFLRKDRPDLHWFSDDIKCLSSSQGKASCSFGQTSSLPCDKQNTSLDKLPRNVPIPTTTDHSHQTKKIRQLSLILISRLSTFFNCYCYRNRKS
jgi:hypothetical protein